MTLTPEHETEPQRPFMTDVEDASRVLAEHSFGDLPDVLPQLDRWADWAQAELDRTRAALEVAEESAFTCHSCGHLQSAHGENGCEPYAKHADCMCGADFTPSTGDLL